MGHREVQARDWCQEDLDGERYWLFRDLDYPSEYGAGEVAGTLLWCQVTEDVMEQCQVLGGGVRALHHLVS